MTSRMSGITRIVGLLIFQVFYKRVILSKIRLRKIIGMKLLFWGLMLAGRVT